MSYEKVTQLKSHLIIGTKQVIRAIENGEINEVIIASDADPKITQKVIEKAHDIGIPHHVVDSKKKLGRACGIEVGASAVAIKKSVSISPS